MVACVVKYDTRKKPAGNTLEGNSTVVVVILPVSDPLIDWSDESSSAVRGTTPVYHTCSARYSAQPPRHAITTRLEQFDRDHIDP